LPAVLSAIEQDTDNTVFLIFQIRLKLLLRFSGSSSGFLKPKKENYILENRDNLTEDSLQEVLSVKIRTEKAIKDAKLRTFITEDSSRDDLVAHIYDVTYGVIKTTDNLVIIDDSIEGTTLKMSIIKMMDRLN
jgi:amidophosphoribosyltransferase